VSVVLPLPPAWAMAYGCAVHAAGFFTARGVRLFGWLQSAEDVRSWHSPSWVMPRSCLSAHHPGCRRSLTA